MTSFTYAILQAANVLLSPPFCQWKTPNITCSTWITTRSPGKTTEQKTRRQKLGHTVTREARRPAPCTSASSWTSSTSRSTSDYLAASCSKFTTSWWRQNRMIQKRGFESFWCVLFPPYLGLWSVSWRQRLLQSACNLSKAEGNHHETATAISTLKPKITRGSHRRPTIKPKATMKRTINISKSPVSKPKSTGMRHFFLAKTPNLPVVCLSSSKLSWRFSVILRLSREGLFMLAFLGV